MLKIADLISTRDYGIKAFLFDLDGTLVDSSEAIIETNKKVLDSNGHSYDEQKIIGMIGMPLEEMFRILIPNLSQAKVNQYTNEYRKHYSNIHLKHTKIQPGTIRLLRKLKDHGFKLGIVTTKYRKPVLEVLHHFNLIDIFDTIVTGYEVKRHKPAPDIILEASKRLGVEAANCAIVGDSPIDIEAGKRAGAITIAVLTGPYTRQQMLKAKPNFLIESLKSIQI